MTSNIEKAFRWVIHRLPIWGTLLIILLGLSGSLAVLTGMSQGWLNQVSLISSRFAAVFLGIFIEAVPFLLIGTIASGLVEEFVSSEGLMEWFPRNKMLAAGLGGLLGLFFPVCECGVIPFGRRLLRKGLPLSAGITAMLAVPVVNPVVMASTYAAFGSGLVFWGRIALTLLIAVSVGVILSYYPGFTNQFEYRNQSASISVIPESKPSPSQMRERVTRMLRIAVDEFFEMGRYLVVGALIAALSQTFISQSTLTQIGSGPVLSVFSLQVTAFLLSICSTVDSFIALVFTGTFTSGSILGFLVFGPMVDIKSVLMYIRVFDKKFVFLLVIMTFIMTLVMGSLINFFEL